MSTRAEIRQARLVRLVDQIATDAANWTAAEYAEGIETGRSGVVSAHVGKRRERAQAKFQATLARLRKAVGPPE